MYGDEGDDEIHGDEGDDEIWGGEGDDRLYGGFNSIGTNKTDVIHGGSGNDVLYGGTTKSLAGYGDGGTDGVVDFKYLYGDEGHDMILGSDFTHN